MSIQLQEHLVYYGFVGIRKTATVVTMSAAIGQKKREESEVARSLHVLCIFVSRGFTKTWVS